MKNIRTTCMKIIFVDCNTEFVNITVPSNITNHDIHKALTHMNQTLFDDGTYDTEGLCADTLLKHLTKTNWSYEKITPDSEWLDTTIYPNN